MRVLQILGIKIISKSTRCTIPTKFFYYYYCFYAENLNNNTIAFS